jgi:hypothetical protein
MTNFPLMRKLVEAAIVAGQTAAHIAKRLDREVTSQPAAKIDPVFPGATGIS